MKWTFREGFLFDEDGQGLVEYGLILTLVAAVALIGLSKLGATAAGLVKGVDEYLAFANPN
jgi:Flp pilus assembly pilin Flp